MDDGYYTGGARSLNHSGAKEAALGQIMAGQAMNTRSPELQSLISRVQVLSKIAAEAEGQIADFLSRIGSPANDCEGNASCDAAVPHGALGELRMAISATETRLNAVLRMVGSFRDIA